MINTIENSRTEFKVKLVDDLEETVIGFLNSKDGGIIYLGVNDNGKIVGLNNNLDLLQRKIKDRIISNIEPSVLGLFDLEVLEEYKKIEDEIGIDFITLSKILKQRFVYDNDQVKIELLGLHIKSDELYLYGFVEDTTQAVYLRLKDYGKTWALDKEEFYKNIK